MICLYVLDEVSAALRAPNGRPLGGAARWWLAQSLRSLQRGLAVLGAPLVLRRGSAASVISGLARDSGAGAVFWNEVEQAPHRAVADEVAAALDVIGATAHRCPSDLLAAPSAIRSKEGRGLRVFTPFWRRLVQVLTHPQEPLPAPKTLRPPSDIASETLESWGLHPRRPDWAGGLPTPGRQAKPPRTPPRGIS